MGGIMVTCTVRVDVSAREVRLSREQISALVEGIGRVVRATREPVVSPVRVALAAPAAPQEDA